MASVAKPRGRAYRVARRLGQVLLGLVLGLVALVAFALVLLQTSFARERIRLLVNDGIAELFQGKLVIDRIGGLSLWGVSGVDARVFDPAGRQVIRAQGLSVVASLPAMAFQLATNADKPELAIALVQLEHADVTLREDEELGVTLAAAFLPRETEEPEPQSPPDSGPRLAIYRLLFERVWAHGSVSGSPPLDADLLNLSASMRQSPTDGFTLDLDRADLVSRALPLAVDPRGRVTGVVHSPAEGAGPLRLELTVDGRAAESPLLLEASWVGDALFAHLTLTRLPASFVNRQVEGLALEGDVTLVVDVDGELPQLDFQAEIDSTAAHLRATGYAVVAEGMELAATVEAARVDVSRLAAGAPPSDLRLRAGVLLLEIEDGTFAGSHRIDIDEGLVSGQATPALWLSGRSHLGSDGIETSGQLGAQEAGIDVRGDYRVELPTAGAGRVRANLTCELEEPARLQRFGVKTSGNAKLSGELRLDTQTFVATTSASLRRVERDIFTARGVELVARASGTLDDPKITAATTLDVLSGRVHADLDYSASKQTLALFAVDIDLVRLANIFGSPLPLQQGTLGLDAKIESIPHSSRYKLDATAKADFGKVGAVNLLARDFELPSSAPTLTTLSRLRGELEAKGKLDLAELSPYITAAQLPIERTTGQVRFEVSAKPGPQSGGLELGVRLNTNGLRIVEERKIPAEIDTTAAAIDSKPFALEGIDVHVAAHTELTTGVLVGTLILRDRGGTLAEVQGEAQLAGVWPDRITDVASLERVPLRATLQVPQRRLGSLPPLLRPSALRGRVALDAQLEGSAAEPTVTVAISAQSLRASGSREPVNVAAEAKYTKTGGALDVVAKLTRTGAEVARTASIWQGDMLRVAELGGGASGITGSMDAALRDFPLDIVPVVIDNQVTGRLSGDLKLSDWGRDARVDAKLSSTSLVVGKIPVQELLVSARTDARNVRAEVAVKVGQGLSRATLDASMRWGQRPLPELEHEGTVKLETRAFNLETLSPLLGAYVSEIGGVLDASTELRVTPTQTKLSGQAKLERGVVQLPSLGQRFSDISARVSVANDEFKLERLEARGTTGRVTVKGSARLDGFDLRGAKATVAIAENEAIPLTVEGAAIGDAWGTIHATYASPARGDRKLDVDVARFHLLTPDNGGQSLQTLDEPADIRVGVRRADGTFVPLPVQPLDPGGDEAAATDAEPAQPLVISVKLGNVVVEKGRTAKAQLAGQLRIRSAEETEVTGRIEVRGGKLDVSGKTFEIERGVVTFDGRDPGNPTITATARWDAPEYTVYAEYLGDVENGRIKLHSEPPLSQDEIASLLLFGSPEGSVGGGDSSNASLAVSVAGDTAAKGLNRVLDDFTNLDVSARVDTTTGSARPELVLQVTPRLAAKVTRAVGAPTANESPDRTFLTLELRLRRAWALSAVIGDRGGSALDLIWRRRY
jgi:TamB, inner membrane protein subunit of TAM complex